MSLPIWRLYCITEGAYFYVESATAPTECPTDPLHSVGEVILYSQANDADAELLDLTDGGDSILHYHDSDRDRANHTGTQLASTISDFDAEVSNNADVFANTSARHSQNSDTKLDDGGANEITAASLRSHVDSTTNPHAVTKTQVGLGNVPNVDMTNVENAVSGLLAAARGGTGLDGSAAANGQLLIGNGAGFNLASLTAGTGISITNGSGNIQISATPGESVPQSYEVSSTVIGTLTSTVYADVPGMSYAVPAAGTYLLNFSCSYSVNSSADRVTDIVVNVNGADQTNSVRSTSTTTSGLKAHHGTSCRITVVAPGDIVKIRARLSGSGTITFYERCLDLVRVSP